MIRRTSAAWAATVLTLTLCAGGVTAQPAATPPPASAAASAPDDADEPTAGQIADPWEPFNRSMFAANRVLDSDLLYPLASAYVGLVPSLLRLGVTNFFNNAQDLWSAANNLLQGKLDRSVMMSFRFVWNTVFGWAGFLDLATELGIERYPEDFGQTLGVWGMPPGNFLVLPFFGPSTVRDAIGLPLDIAASPAYAVNQGSFRPLTTVVQILDSRSQLLDSGKLLDTVALDPYSFVRDAYLARRFNLVYDGDPPVPASDKAAPK